MSTSVYQQPLYYLIAFSFVNPKTQVDQFERIIEEFSKTKVKRFLDIACGPSLQLREIAKRGYEAVGLDSSSEMLEYLEEKAKEEALIIETVIADLREFRLKKKADFAFIMMGSLNVDSNESLLKHLDSVADSLSKGGLYFIQNQRLDWTKTKRQSWTIRRDGIKVKATFESKFISIVNQQYRERIILEVHDQGVEKTLTQQQDFKFIFPQEFKSLIEMNGRFEFLGWWKGNCDRWYLNKPLEKTRKLDDNMVLLRRK